MKVREAAYGGLLAVTVRKTGDEGMIENLRRKMEEGRRFGSQNGVTC